METININSGKGRGLSTEFLMIETTPLTVCNFPLRKTLVTAKGRNVKSAQTTRLKILTPNWYGCSRLSTSGLTSLSHLPTGKCQLSPALPPQTPGRPPVAETCVPDGRADVTVRRLGPAEAGGRIPGRGGAARLGADSRRPTPAAC